MENDFTICKKKSVKQMKPARHIIKNLLNYSKSLAMVPDGYGHSIMLINN